jgi:hypothetical protein
VRGARIAVVALCVLAAAPAAAHIGSPHIYLEDNAGPFPVVAVVHMPPAIPGEADLQLRLQDRAPGEEVEVSVREVPPQGVSHAPDWIPARESKVDRNFLTAPIPLMRFGVWKAQVRVRGERGEGMIEITVPAKRPNPGVMKLQLSGFLGTLVVLLLGSGWTMLVTMRRDAVHPPGVEPSAADRRAGVRIATVGMGIVVAWMGFIGFSWFNADVAHRRMGIPGLQGTLNVLNPPVLAGKPVSAELVVRDRRDAAVTDLVEDRGRLMHLVVVDRPGGTYMLHAHPTMVQPGKFNVRFVPPEAGRYTLLGDVVQESGEGQTVTATLDVQAGRPTRTPATVDAEDAYSFQPAMQEAVVGAITSDVGDGLVMRFVDPDPISLERGEFYRLTFQLEDEQGQVVGPLEPYDSGDGHMIVLRHDEQVYTRLYPTGSPAGGRVSGSGGVAAPAAADTARVSFPYGFPERGTYRCWVQVKYLGRIRTGVFDVAIR